MEGDFEDGDDGHSLPHSSDSEITGTTAVSLLGKGDLGYQPDVPLKGRTRYKAQLV